MSWRYRATQALRRLCHVLAAIALFGMAGLTLYDVIARKLFSAPIVGVIDVVSFCVMWATMLGIALAWAERAHIVVDILNFNSPRVTAAFHLLTRVTGIVIMPLLMWLAWQELRDVYDFGDRSPDVRIPIFLYWAAPVVGYALSAIFLLIAPPYTERSSNA